MARSHRHVTDVLMFGAAAGALMAARLLLACAPAATVRRVTGASSPAAPDARVRAAALGVVRAAARGPSTFTCLEQAIALNLLLVPLRRTGRVVLAVGPGARTPRAHAWVECGGEIVLGGGGRTADLVPLTRPLAAPE